EGHRNHLPVVGPPVAPAGLSHRDRRHGCRSLQSGAVGGRTARHLSAGHRSGRTTRSVGRSRRSQHLRAVMLAPRRGHEIHSKLGGNLMGLSDLRSRVAVLPLLLAGCLAAVPLQAQEAGERVYIANEYNADISVIDTATDTVIATIPISERPGEVRPRGMAVSPDGRTIYVAVSDFNPQFETPEDKIVAIDVLTNEIVSE